MRLADAVEVFKDLLAEDADAELCVFNSDLFPIKATSLETFNFKGQPLKIVVKAE